MRIILIFFLLITNIVVGNPRIIKLEKECDSLIRSNIIHYNMCLNWNLSENDVKHIWKNMTEIEFPGITQSFIYRYDIQDNGVRINSIIEDVNSKGKKVSYDVIIGPMSWIHTINLISNENKLFQYENNDHLFLGHFIGGDYDYEEDPDLADSDPYPDNYQQAIDNLMKVGELNQSTLFLKDKIFNLTPDHRIPSHLSVELTEKNCKLVYQKGNHREDTDCYVRIFDDYIYIYNNLSNHFYKKHAFNFYTGVFITKIKIEK